MNKMIGLLWLSFLVLFGGMWAYHQLMSSRTPTAPETNRQKELDQIQSQLNLLNQTNQKKIEESKQIQTLDGQLNQEIRFHMGLVQEKN